MSIFAAAGDVLGSVASGLFNAREADKNRDFQRMMANTSYTRAAADLERAGLNRVLALGSPGAVPPGAQGVMAPSSPGSTFANASSALQQVEQSRAQEDLINEQSKLIAQQARSAKSQADKDHVTKLFYDAVLPLADQLRDWAKNNLDGSIDLDGVIQGAIERAVDNIFSGIADFTRSDSVHAKAGRAGYAFGKIVREQLQSVIDLFTNPSKLFE